MAAPSPGQGPPTPDGPAPPLAPKPGRHTLNVHTDPILGSSGFWSVKYHRWVMRGERGPSGARSGTYSSPAGAEGGGTAVSEPKTREQTLQRVGAAPTADRNVGRAALDGCSPASAPTCPCFPKGAPQFSRGSPLLLGLPPFTRAPPLLPGAPHLPNFYFSDSLHGAQPCACRRGSVRAGKDRLLPPGWGCRGFSPFPQDSRGKMV